MKTAWRRNAWVFVLLLVAGGCSTPRAQFHPVREYQADKLASQNIIKISELKLEGDLAKRTANLVQPLVAGMTRQNNMLTIVGDSDRSSYHEGELFIKIMATASLSAGDMWKFTPLIGMYSAYGGSDLTYNWTTTVAYDFKDSSGKRLVQGEFLIEGKDTYKRSMGEVWAGAAVVGIATQKKSYLNTDTLAIVGDRMLDLAGDEIGKRFAAEPLRSYLLAKEKQRDGMDIKTYIAFLDQKKQLEAERKSMKEQRLKDLDVLVTNADELTGLHSGNVMVLGVGVSRYQSEQIPALRFADKDGRRVVDFFKRKYKLSDDRAMLLTNEDATAIKISRFITNNAMKLLDKDDTFIFYFSGHGAPDVDASSKDSDGLKKYLLMHNSEMDALPLTAVSLDNLASLVEKLPCKRVVLLLDSCFAGTAGAQTLAKLKSVRIDDRSYKNMTDMSGKGRVILAASSEKQVSHEDDRLQSGVFTHFLLEGLQGRADKGDGKINILGLYEYVTKEVTKQTENKQTPVFRGTLDANIVF